MDVTPRWVAQELGRQFLATQGCLPHPLTVIFDDGQRVTIRSAALPQGPPFTARASDLGRLLSVVPRFLPPVDRAARDGLFRALNRGSDAE